MKLAIIGNTLQREELLGATISPALHITYLDDPELVNEADYYIDLLFDGTQPRLEQWKKLTSVPVILNSVETVPAGFVRINGWPGCLKSAVIEVAGPGETQRSTDQLFDLLGKKAEWVPNIPGFIFPRILSMIINEAHFTIEEGVCKEADIDTAMKLGTNYPFGPFEWGKHIGWKNIFSLLTILAKEDSRYIPSKLLARKAN